MKEWRVGVTQSRVEMARFVDKMRGWEGNWTEPFWNTHDYYNLMQFLVTFTIQTKEEYGKKD